MANATKSEILETTDVAVVMAGGPAFMHVPMVIQALEDLA